MLIDTPRFRVKLKIKAWVSVLVTCPTFENLLIANHSCTNKTEAHTYMQTQNLLTIIVSKIGDIYAFMNIYRFLFLTMKESYEVSKCKEQSVK